VRFLGWTAASCWPCGETLSRLREAAHGETLNILALSGGGAGGAFVPAHSSASRAAEIVRSSRSSRESASAR